MDWKLLLTEDARRQHIRCHELQDGDNLRELIASFQKAYAVAVVLINTSDDYILQSSFLSGAQRSYFPVMVLTNSDGIDLLQIMKQYEKAVFGKITTDYVDTLQSLQLARGEPIHTYSDQTASKEPGQQCSM